MAKLNYFTVGSNRLEDAKAFYDALLGSIEMNPVYEHPSGGRLYRGKGVGMFGVLGPFDGGEACIGNGTMAGFGFDTQAEVDAFHAKALALGGVCDGAPGERMPGMYFAYFRDLDGNKLCAYNLSRPS
ncbi:VOC family protein [Caulobacter sp. NIBR2454]|uniref:VOC family protein n=1 Tax=Caulobacter sp. NIBR2454 TaxID=3015996 RepID=UPI0022B74DC3|nr:VOC family protein [Caulobacter sp. NIBR2454]